MQLSSLASQVGLVAKNPLANARDIRVASSIPALGRSPGEGTSNPLHCSCLGNPMDWGAWWATAQVVTGLDMAEPVHIVVSFSFPVTSNSLWPHGLQQARPPRASPFLGVCLSSSSLCLWCCPAISSSDTHSSFHSQSCPTSWTFPVNPLFTSNDQNTGASASPSVLPVNIQGWSPLRSTALISLPSKGLSRVFSSTTVWRHQLFGVLPSLWSNSHIGTWLLERPKPYLYGPLSSE